MIDPATLRALAAELCEEPRSRFALDQAIARALGQDDANPPPYTASLDAKLPGEDIVVVFAPFCSNDPIKHGDHWAAMNRGTVWGYGDTEPLARRAAGLLAMAQEKET